MDILRTNLQEQADQMLQEVEAQMHRYHSNALKSLNDKNQEEIRIKNERNVALKSIL